MHLIIRLGSSQFLSKNHDLSYERTAKSDYGFPTSSHTHFNPPATPMQRSRHRPFLNEFPVLNRPGLSPLQRLSPETQQPHHGYETNASYPPSAILQEIYGS